MKRDIKRERERERDLERERGRSKRSSICTHAKKNNFDVDGI
jgi:hypothetical protein